MLVALAYLAAFAVLTRGQSTNPVDYTFTPPGLVHLDVTKPTPQERMDLSGAQSIQQLKSAFVAFATNEHYAAGGHKTNFLKGYMMPAGVLQTRHLSNISYQVAASNGVAQLPATDVFLQWCWVDGTFLTSSIWSVSWPQPFTQMVWWADAGPFLQMTQDPSTIPVSGTWNAAEYSSARCVTVTVNGVAGTISISGAWTTNQPHRVCVMGLGR